jgi:hypothetical protein
MKQVFDNSNVAHLWANKVQDNARNAHNNFYFEDDTIYSYGGHFPIAKHVENESGESAVLFTTRNYSMTTNKHKSIVRQAANHKRIIYCNTPGDKNHWYNFDKWQKESELVAANLAIAKKPEKYLSAIGAIAYSVKTYADFFTVEIPEALRLILSIANKEEYIQYADKKKELEEAAEKKRQAELKAKHKKELADWLAGKKDRLYVRDGYDYLRINNGQIETSQGIDLSIEYGLKIYEKLKEDRLKVGDKVLQFDVIKMNGVVTIGCHNFKKSYLLSFGSKLEKIPSINS